MNNWLKNSGRFVLVTVGIIVLTSFSIDATDTLRDSQTALSLFTKTMTNSSCPKNMVLVDNGDFHFCIDKYEASPSADCIVAEPQSVTDTAHNAADANCLPLSEPNKTPWTFVAKPQAVQLCAKAGKRLPSAEEWYLSALGTPDNPKNCNLAGSMKLTGLGVDCISGVGARDMIGNVWELVEDIIIDGVYDGKSLPPEGYISMVDSAGVALETTSTPEEIYNKDYFWAKDSGRFAMLRGGYYGSRDDGGLYTVHAQTDQNFASAAIGFRCVKLPS